MSDPQDKCRTKGKADPEKQIDSCTLFNSPRIHIFKNVLVADLYQANSEICFWEVEFLDVFLTKVRRLKLLV